MPRYEGWAELRRDALSGEWATVGVWMRQAPNDRPSWHGVDDRAPRPAREREAGVVRWERLMPVVAGSAAEAAKTVLGLGQDAFGTAPAAHDYPEWTIRLPDPD